MARKRSRISLNKVPIPQTLHFPPRMIHDEEGSLVGVILAYADYQTFLRILAAYADWEELPPYLQDAIDNLLADEALAEAGESIPLRKVLAETGDLPE